MAVEDFTTYTELDDNTHITVDSNTIVHIIYENEDARVYKDFGASHFGDYQHDFTMICDNSSGEDVIAVIDCISDFVDDRKSLIEGDHTYVCIRWDGDLPGGKIGILIEECDNGVAHISSILELTDGNTYYVTVIKSGTAFSASVYSDASRETLVGTISLTLQHNYTLQYLIVTNTRNRASGAYQMTCTVEDLNLNEEVVEATFGSSIIPILKGIGIF